MKPHLECTDVEKEGEGEIAEINRTNFKEVLDQNKISIIAVFARRC
jgi:thiol-disulfide isomerase/thioredoxin